jgi:hypothetical protein
MTFSRSRIASSMSWCVSGNEHVGLAHQHAQFIGGDFRAPVFLCTETPNSDSVRLPMDIHEPHEGIQNSHSSGLSRNVGDGKGDAFRAAAPPTSWARLRQTPGSRTSAGRSAMAIAASP